MSRLTERTLEMWTPRLRWMPEQRMHRKTPRFHDAQRGPAEEGRLRGAVEGGREGWRWVRCERRDGQKRESVRVCLCVCVCVFPLH